jgi:hypothetical protein
VTLFELSRRARAMEQRKLKYVLVFAGVLVVCLLLLTLF